MSAAFHSAVGETATAVRVGCAVCKARSTSFPVTSFPVNPWEAKTYMYSHPEIDRYYVYLYIYIYGLHIYICISYVRNVLGFFRRSCSIYFRMAVALKYVRSLSTVMQGATRDDKPKNLKCFGNHIVSLYILYGHMGPGYKL